MMTIIPKSIHVQQATEETLSLLFNCDRIADTELPGSANACLAGIGAGFVGFGNKSWMLLEETCTKLMNEWIKSASRHKQCDCLTFDERSPFCL